MSGVEVARQGADAAVIEAAEQIADCRDPFGSVPYAHFIQLHDAVAARRAVLAPPPPPRRQEIVIYERRRVDPGDWYEAVDRKLWQWNSDRTSDVPFWVRVSVEPVGPNTVTLEPGQYVVEVRTPTSDDIPFMADKSGQVHLEVLKSCVVVREYTEPAS